MQTSATVQVHLTSSDPEMEREEPQSPQILILWPFDLKFLFFSGGKRKKEKQEK